MFDLTRTWRNFGGGILLVSSIYNGETDDEENVENRHETYSEKSNQQEYGQGLSIITSFWVGISLVIGLACGNLSRF